MRFSFLFSLILKDRTFYIHTSMLTKNVFLVTLKAKYQMSRPKWNFATIWAHIMPYRLSTKQILLINHYESPCTMPGTGLKVWLVGTFITLHLLCYTTLHYITLHYIHYVILLYITLHSLLYIMFITIRHYVMLHQSQRPWWKTWKNCFVYKCLYIHYIAIIILYSLYYIHYILLR